MVLLQIIDLVLSLGGKALNFMTETVIPKGIKKCQAAQHAEDDIIAFDYSRLLVESYPKEEALKIKFILANRHKLVIICEGVKVLLVYIFRLNQ